MKTMIPWLIAAVMLSNTLGAEPIPENLREPGRLWCKEHERYEDRCWLCHPEIEEKTRPYCAKHYLYQDECFMCRPELKANPAAQTQPDPPRLFCKEHSVYEDECGICHPELVTTQGMKVRMPSPESAATAGIRAVPPQVAPISAGVECYAEIVFNQNKLAQIAAPVGGIVQSVDVDLGDNVEEKQTVTKIWSAAIAETVAKAVLTHQTLERERKLRAERVTSERELQEAEAAHRTACQQARTLGFTEEQIDALGRAPVESVMLEVRAPFGGEIVERTAVRGALVEAGKPLFTLADRSTMWAMLNIPETQLARVRVGQTVELTVESLPGRTFTGVLTWISAQVDERTRLARARAELANPDGSLRAQMFARARILTANSDNAVLVPQSAIQQVDGKPLIFVQIEPDLFEARRVRLGAKHDGQVEILDGLRAEDRVVVRGGFIVKSQLLISRLGAGCVDN